MCMYSRWQSSVRRSLLPSKVVGTPGAVVHLSRPPAPLAEIYPFIEDAGALLGLAGAFAHLRCVWRLERMGGRVVQHCAYVVSLPSGRQAHKAYANGR